MAKRNTLKQEYYKLNYWWKDADGKPRIEYVNWLEDKILEKKMNYKLITNVQIGGFDSTDYPDFADAYIESADYNGKPMTEFQLEDLSNVFIYEQIIIKSIG